MDEVYQGLAPVELSRDDMDAMEVRGVDAPRSILLAGAIATVLVGHNFNRGNPSSGGTHSGGSGGQENSRCVMRV